MNRTTEITETISSSCSLPLHEIVGGDLAARGDGDLLRRIARDPDHVAHQQRHSAGRQAGSRREFFLTDALPRQIFCKLHGRGLAQLNHDFQRSVNYPIVSLV